MLKRVGELELQGYDSHDDVLVPLEVVVMEISSWVEPKVNLLLPATSAIGEYVGVDEVR